MNTWNDLTMCKQRISNNSFKNKIPYKLFAYKSYICIRDLALNNAQELMSHKSPTNQIKIN